MKPKYESLIDASFQKLIARRRTLLRQVPALAQEEQAKREAETNDWIDRAVSVESETLLHALADTERKELVEIEAALDRIADHRFGTCESCGHAIAERRLEAMPEARTCVACSAQRERAAV